MSTSQNQALLSNLEDLILHQQQIFYQIQNKENLQSTLFSYKEAIDSLKRNIMSLNRISLKDCLRQISFQLSNIKVNFSDSDETLGIDEENHPYVTELLSTFTQNFLDHGLESEEERNNFNKPALSSFMIKIYSKNEEIHIDISDDGRGLNPLKINQMLLEKEILTSEELKKLSQEELYHKYFHPKITSTSPIQSLLYKLDGRIAISSHPGFGTKFTCIFPLKTNLIKGLVVSLNEEYYVIPQRFVKMIHKIDDSIPLLYLNAKSDNNEYAIRLQLNNQVLGFVVDNVFKTEEIVIKNDDSVPHMIGYTILSNGIKAYVVDPKSLLQQNKSCISETINYNTIIN